MKICDLNNFDTNKIVFETEEFMDENNEMITRINFKNGVSPLIFKLKNHYQFEIHKHPEFDKYEFSCSIPSTNSESIKNNIIDEILNYCISE